MSPGLHGEMITTNKKGEVKLNMPRWRSVMMWRSVGCVRKEGGFTSTICWIWCGFRSICTQNGPQMVQCNNLGGGFFLFISLHSSGGHATWLVSKAAVSAWETVWTRLTFLFYFFQFLHVSWDSQTLTGQKFCIVLLSRLTEDWWGGYWMQYIYYPECFAPGAKTSMWNWQHHHSKKLWKKNRVLSNSESCRKPENSITLLYLLHKDLISPIKLDFFSVQCYMNKAKWLTTFS